MVTFWNICRLSTSERKPNPNGTPRKICMIKVQNTAVERCNNSQPFFFYFLSIICFITSFFTVFRFLKNVFVEYLSLHFVELTLTVLSRVCRWWNNVTFWCCFHSVFSQRSHVRFLTCYTDKLVTCSAFSRHYLVFATPEESVLITK